MYICPPHKHTGPLVRQNGNRCTTENDQKSVQNGAYLTQSLIQNFGQLNLRAKSECLERVPEFLVETMELLVKLVVR